jgi:hypothetical protein
MLSRESVVEDIVSVLAAHRQLAQQFAAGQRAYLALAQAVLDDAKSTTPELFHGHGNRLYAVRQAA